MRNDSTCTHIIQYCKEYSLCTGCHSCELMCALTHDGITGPTHNRIWCELGKIDEMIHHIYACQHCDDHPCYEACPKKDKAMCIDTETGVVYINENECIGCGLCAKKCKFTPSRINLIKDKDRKKRKAKKCDLCRGRKEGPACVEHCPARCIGLSNEPLPYETDEKGAYRKA